jgi:hypothetical protein
MAFKWGGAEIFSACLLSPFNQPSFYGKSRQGRHIVEFELSHQIGTMFFNSFQTNAEVIGNLFVLVPLGDELQDFSLPLG